jgi:hypothetical protein
MELNFHKGVINYMAEAYTDNDSIIRGILTSIPDGKYHWVKSEPWLKFFKKKTYHGWLTVETNKEHKNFIWTTHKNTHEPSSSKAKNLTVDKETGQLLFYMVAGFSCHVRWSIYNQDSKYKDAMLNFANDI